MLHFAIFRGQRDEYDIMIMDSKRGHTYVTNFNIILLSRKE